MCLHIVVLSNTQGKKLKKRGKTQKAIFQSAGSKCVG